MAITKFIISALAVATTAAGKSLIPLLDLHDLQFSPSTRMRGPRDYSILNFALISDPNLHPVGRVANAWSVKYSSM